MIWNYQATFRTLAPAFKIRKKTKLSTIKLLAFDNLNKALNDLVDIYSPLRKERAEVQI